MTLKWIKSKIERLKQNELWWYSLILILSARVTDIINLVISIFIVPDQMQSSDMGAILPLMRMINVLAVPITILAAVTIRFSSKFEAQSQKEKTNKLLQDFLLLGSCMGFVILLLLVLYAPEIGKYYEVSDIRVIWVVGAVAFIACTAPSMQSTIQSFEKYRMFAWGNFLAPSLRLLLALFLIGPLQILGLFIANFSASLCRFLLMAWDAKSLLFSRRGRLSYAQEKKSMMRFAIPFGAYTLMINVQAFMEASTVRTVLGEADSAGFFMITMLGSAPMFLLASLTPILLPMLSHRHERKNSSEKTHVLMLIGALGLGLFITALLAIVGPFIFTWKTDWLPFQPYGKYLWILGLIYCITAVDTIHRTNLHAQSRFQYLKYYCPVILIELIALWFFSRQSGLQNLLGEGFEFLTSLILMLMIRLILLIGIFVEIFSRRTAT